MRTHSRLLMISLTTLSLSCKSQPAVRAQAHDPPSAQSTPAAKPAPERMFETAVFYRPAEDVFDGPEKQLAPLIIQEVDPEQYRRSEADIFFTFIPDGWITLCVDPWKPVPTVYVARRTVKIHHADHEQYSYVWRYMRHSSEGLTSRGGFDFRITLGENGNPLVYELFSTYSRSRKLYVSTSLDAAAQKEFGKPLAGRKYSIERGLSETPGIVVERTIDDGPMPLGPYIYLGVEPQHEIVALTCRCEKSLAKSFEDEIGFSLRSLPDFLDDLKSQYEAVTKYYQSEHKDIPSIDLYEPYVPSVVEGEPPFEKLFRWPTNMPN